VHELYLVSKQSSVTASDLHVRRNSVLF